eukprot:172078-Chlamydomonas_euryale.AAC.2
MGAQVTKPKWGGPRWVRWQGKTSSGSHLRDGASVRVVVERPVAALAGDVGRLVEAVRAQVDALQATCGVVGVRGVSKGCACRVCKQASVEAKGARAECESEYGS